MSGGRKLIEVALPLEAIDEASRREKSPFTRDHPRALHVWWARRPLAACRAVLFATLVDDPSSRPDEFPTEEEQEAERQRLFGIIEELVKWENSNNDRLLADARDEILRSTTGRPPAVLDPFCGGASIPLEAQRLGLEAHASDLNPVAVLIAKALIEIPPRFSGQAPVNSESRGDATNSGTWPGASGLAEDVRHYGSWMRSEAKKRVGHLYPPVEGRGRTESKPLAWIWARTVACPNPACGTDAPLVRSFVLSKKKGHEAWVRPVVMESRGVRFEVMTDKRGSPDGTVNRRGATCIVCGSPMPLEYIRSEGREGRIGARLMAIVAEHSGRQVFLAPSDLQGSTATTTEAHWAPETELPAQALSFRVQAYGMTQHKDLFTSRQLAVLATLADLVGDVRQLILKDANEAGLPSDAVSDVPGGSAATGTLMRFKPISASRFLGLSTSATPFVRGTLATRTCANCSRGRRYRWHGTSQRPIS